MIIEIRANPTNPKHTLTNLFERDVSLPVAIEELTVSWPNFALHCM
jgi:hypothetical protein